jgi:hypothetical protein
MNPFKLFPQLDKAVWGELNLNTQALRTCVETEERNILLDPRICQKWLELVHLLNGVDYSFGGYLESRSFLWRGHYHKPDSFIHLGIDYNVPAGTVVRWPYVSEVVDSWHDPDQDGGWGGRIILRYAAMDSANPVSSVVHERFTIIGHLEPESMAKKGDIIRPKDSDRHFIGVVGEPNVNGNWFPHLHVQGISPNVAALGRLAATRRLWPYVRGHRD